VTDRLVLRRTVPSPSSSSSSSGEYKGVGIGVMASIERRIEAPEREID
jgi:hypothetical protein